MELTDVMQAFKSGDFARNNLFRVRIPHLGETFEFKCRATTAPPATLEKIPVAFMNRKINVAGDRTYDDWTITIYNDDEHETRDQLLQWQNDAHAMGNRIHGKAPAEYKHDAVIMQYNRAGEKTKEYNVVGSFPLVIGELVLDWENNNEVQTFECQLAIDWWTSDGIN